MKATTGGIIIEAGVQRKKEEGGIIIPVKARQVRSKIGKVIAITPYPVGTTQKLWQGGTQGGRRKVVISQARVDEDLSLIGQHVLLSEGQEFIDKGIIYVKGKVEHVIAVTGAPKDTQFVSDGSPERCPRCKSRGESNLLLDDKGYCTNCNLNPAGEHRDSYDHRKVSDDASDHMSGRTSRDANRKRSGLAEHGKVISYAGQKNHTALKTQK